jgi:hypothetical protein
MGAHRSVRHTDVRRPSIGKDKAGIMTYHRIDIPLTDPERMRLLTTVLHHVATFGAKQHDRRLMRLIAGVDTRVIVQRARPLATIDRELPDDDL